MDIKQMRQQRAAILAQAKGILNGAQSAKRGLTTEERSQYDALMAQADQMKGDIERAERMASEEHDLGQAATDANRPNPGPAINHSGFGDSETRAILHYIRTGDRSRELRASNDTDMNIGTAADGGVLVPTGLYQGIIAKRDEGMLARKLGVLNIPGIGTTVDVPYDNGTANEFVSTAEANAFDRDAPALAKASMTLVLYSKKVTLSYQLLQDNDARLEDFLTNYIGRAMAKTHNKLLVTEALASGTTNTLAAAAAATASDISELVYAMKGEYADNAQWVMKRATQGAFLALTGSPFQFMNTPPGGANALWTFPVNNSEYVPAIGTGNKSMILGNFEYMGMREAPALTMLRDPYSSASTGQVNLFYYFRTVYKVLEAEAIQYGTHP